MGRKAGKCVHFNGMQNDCCKAGVNYKELCGPAPGYGARLPCFGKEDKPGHVECDKFQEPTQEEIDADEAWLKERIEKQRKVGPLVIEIKARHKIPGKRPKFKSGQEKHPCPACGTGDLHVAISGYNGHSQGQCTTEGCVSWIE